MALEPKTTGRQPLLQIEALSVSFRDSAGSETRVLDGIDLTVEHGEVFALAGESGSGKTTLGMAILGLLARESRPVVSGRIRLDGTDIVGASPATMRRLLQRDIAAVFQDPMTSLNPTMKIKRQLQEANRSSIVASEWLQRVGIGEAERCLRSYPHELSGGQRQRVMIAMAMARGPKLVVADEPTTALDVTVQAQILELIRDLARQQGTAFLFVTHDLAVATALADRIAVLYAGRVAERGRTKAVVDAPAHPYTAALLDARFGVDVRRDRPLPTLPGAGTASSGTGCAFAPRCPLVAEECRSVQPRPRPALLHDGVAACHRIEAAAERTRETSHGTWPEMPPPLASEPAFEMIDVSKSFRRRGGSVSPGGSRNVRALSHVSLSVVQGEAVAIVGESGSGKSTLLRLASGTLNPDSGQVRRAGRERPQIVFQAAAASLTPWLSVERQLDDRLRPFERDRTARRERIATALEQVGLPTGLASAMPGALSGGQAQRIAIARAIIVPPRLLLCDEAVSAMDISLAAATLNLLGALRRRLGMSLLFVTHDLAAARFIADRIIVLKDGEVVEAGDAEQVVGEPQHAFTRQLVADLPDRLHFVGA